MGPAPQRLLGGTEALNSHTLAVPMPVTSLLGASGRSQGEHGPVLPSSLWWAVQVVTCPSGWHTWWAIRGATMPHQARCAPSCPRKRPPGSSHQHHPARSPCDDGSPTRATGSPAGSSRDSHVGATRGPAERAGSLPRGSQKREKMAKPQFVKIRNLLKRKKGWAKPGWGSLARGVRLSRDAKPGAGGVPATAADERGAWGPASSGY